LVWLLKEEETDYLGIDPAETILEVSKSELKEWVVAVIGLSSGVNLGLRPSYSVQITK